MKMPKMNAKNLMIVAVAIYVVMYLKGSAPAPTVTQSSEAASAASAEGVKQAMAAPASYMDGMNM